MAEHRGFNVSRQLVEEVRRVSAERGVPIVDLTKDAVLVTQESFPVVYRGGVHDRPAEHKVSTDWKTVQVRQGGGETIVETIRRLALQHDLSMDEVVRRSLRWYLGIDRDVGTRVIADGQTCCLVRDLGQYYQVRGIDGQELFFDADRCRIEGVLGKEAA